MFSTYSIVNGEWGDYLYSEIFSYDRNGNITDLYRFDENDLVDVLDFIYNGNKITSISDYAANYIPSVNTKHYRNLLNDQTEFEYDRNGNMTKDLDRNICKIRYNVLNLPDIIQFGNGNQISHVYDAEGNRVKTTYYTRKATAAISVGNILEPKDSISNYSVTREFLNGNVRYIRYSTSSELFVDYIFNPEGYYRYYTSFDRYPFYYISDHIGNICQTWIYPAENYKVCVQKMQNLAKTKD